MANGFSGSYFYQIDEKGRMRSPTEIRNSLGSGLRIGYGLGKYLVIYTAESYERESENQMKVNPVTERTQYKYYRNLFLSMMPFECDAQGRFKIPVQFRNEFGFKDNAEVVVIGNNTTVEIWSKKYFELRNNDDVAYYMVLTDEERNQADERLAALEKAKAEDKK